MQTAYIIDAIRTPFGRYGGSLASVRADDDSRINPNGGAIAVGHPLGASGARLVTTALNQLENINGKYALCSVCIGVGQGINLIIERV